MPHEIDEGATGARAIYARKPAWHGLGVVKEDGWFTAAEALSVLNPNSDPIIKVPAAGLVNGEWVVSDEMRAVVRINPDTGKPQILSFMSEDYGIVQLEDQFAFMDGVVGAIGGAHYETAALLRRGKQAFLTIDTGAIVLDEKGRNDRIQKYILGVNSYDGSQAFRVKMTNVRVECANMLAMALRGSTGEIVSGDWSTRHTKDIMERTAAAQHTLGLWKQYNDTWTVVAEKLINTPMSDGAFERLIEGLFESDKTGVKEVDRAGVEEVRTVYDLSPACEKIRGTAWGGLNAYTEWQDWNAKVRGGKRTTVQEARLKRQLDGTGAEKKQEAWERFTSWADENRKGLVGV